MNKGTKILILGVVLIFASIVIPLAIFLTMLFSQDPPKSFLIPGELKVSISEPGEYYVWNNHQSVFQGKTYQFGESIPGNLKISLLAENGGESLMLIGDTSISSSDMGESRNSIGYFVIEKVGEYVLRVEGESQERVFSFGKSFLAKFFITFFLGALAGGLVGLCGFALMIYGIVLIVRAKG